MLLIFTKNKIIEALNQARAVAVLQAMTGMALHQVGPHPLLLESLAREAVANQARVPQAMIITMDIGLG